MATAKYPFCGFRPCPEVKDVIDQLPYGTRSDFINEAIIAGAKTAGIQLIKKGRVNNSEKTSTNTSEQNANFSEQPKPSAEAAATTKENSIALQPKTRNTGKLTNVLRRLEAKK